MFAAQFQEAIAILEASGDGFALQVFERQQIIIDLKWHAGMLAAM